MAQTSMAYIPCGYRMYISSSFYISFSFITNPAYARYGVFSPPALDWEDPQGLRVPFFHCGLQTVYFQDGDLLGLLLPILAFPVTISVEAPDGQG